MSNDVVLRHYLREDVQAEVSKFCRDRWVAIETASSIGKRIFYRYINDKPLTIKEPADIKRLINKLGKRQIRTIYGSANIYRSLLARTDVNDRENILKVTPTIDIDCSLGEVDLAVDAARIIINELNRHGVEHSIYVVWSGRGLHIHLNENAISDAYWRSGPIELGYTVVEYILRQVRKELAEKCAESIDAQRKLKVENLMDIQRVFTSPLSIHRELDIVAVTINPDELENFSLDWIGIENFRYWKEWDRAVEGEADELVEKALRTISHEERARTKIGNQEPLESKPPIRQPSTSLHGVGRFQIMALLQAARHYLIRGDIQLAKSFGLNRAIFYAWAKKRGVAATSRRRLEARPLATASRAETNEIEEKIGDEVAYRRVGGWYVIGGEQQRPEDFDRQIVSRLGGQKNFQEYWNSALKYLQRFPREVLESQREFFEKIYLPVRDNPEKIFGKEDNASSSSG